MREFLALDLANLFHAPFMMAGAKLCVEPCPHNSRQLSLRGSARTKGQHVRIVVLSSQSGSLFIPGYGGSHAGNFVGSDGHAGSRSAHEHSLFDVAAPDFIAHFASIVGIID